MDTLSDDPDAEEKPARPEDLRIPYPFFQSEFVPKCSMISGASDRLMAVPFRFNARVDQTRIASPRVNRTLYLFIQTTELPLWRRRKWATLIYVGAFLTGAGPLPFIFYMAQIPDMIMRYLPAVVIWFLGLWVWWYLVLVWLKQTPWVSYDTWKGEICLGIPRPEVRKIFADAVDQWRRSDPDAT